MVFSYYDSNGKINNLDIKIGSKWSEVKSGDELLNSIFSKIDNGNKIVDEKEFAVLHYLLNKNNNLTENEAKNKVAGYYELILLDNQLNSGKYDLEELRNGRIDKINPEMYSLENLENRYPSSKYKIYTSSDDSKSRFRITNPQKHNTDKLIVDKFKDSYVICEVDSKNIFQYTEKCYDLDGNLKYYRDLDNCYHYPLATDLYNLITGKYPPEKTEELLQSITADNIKDVFVGLDKTYNVTLSGLLSSSSYIEKNCDIKSKIMEHINNLVVMPHEEYETQIVNDEVGYKGEEFYVTKDNNIITVKNKKTNEETALNLTEICRFLPYDKGILIKLALQKMPAESLVDFSKDVKLAVNLNNDSRSGYSSNDDSIYLSVSMYENKTVLGTLVHEMGHALDYMYVNDKNTQSTDSQNFVKIFNNELKKFIADGNIQYEEKWDPETKTHKHVKGEVCNYATWNEKEMFAECYKLLMIGECTSKGCILKYFPETLKASEKHIKFIRSQENDIRHRK